MAYAVVYDVPASWDDYEAFGSAIRARVPDGMIVHLAGPTDEGFRMIEIWETPETWERFRIRFGEPAAFWARTTLVPPTVRALDALSAVHARRQSVRRRNHA